MKNRLLQALVAFVVAALSGRSAYGCTACFGQSDSPLATGMNFGILTLLIVVVCVLSTLGAFFIYLARRAARYPVPGPDMDNNDFSENPTKA